MPKVAGRSQRMSVSSFRGISINPVLSNLFIEMAVLHRFNGLFVTSDYQFGFKKKLSCKHAIFNVRTVRNVIDHYINGQSTVNLRFANLSNMFYKMNHCALFLKLLKRNFPIQLINVFVQLFNVSTTYVRLGNSFS